MNGPILEALRLPDPQENDKFTFEEEEMECLLCEQKFLIYGGGFLPSPKKDSQEKDGKDSFFKHLLIDHSVVIGDIHLVANLPQYIKYWKQKFSSRPMTEYCITIKAPVRDTESPLRLTMSSELAENSQQLKEEGEIREFFMLSDVIPEDKQLRLQLQMDRLERVLRIHEEENNSTEFHRTCLFCRQEFDRHADLFDHMAFDHNFSVGQPANLVFVNKFLDLLQEKLSNLVCLFCEKIFKSRDVLKEHMRKKGHKRLNPQNKEYDVFYIVNYLEFGRTWEDISRDPAEDEITSGFHVEKDDNHEWGNWRDNLGKVICLFCVASYSHNTDLFNHMVQIHGFDFVKLKQEMELTFYQQMKLINYIRRCVHLNSCLGCNVVLESREKLMEHLSWANHFNPAAEVWNQSQFLFPTYENDNLLHCLEEDNAEDMKIESDDMVVPEPVDDRLKESILQNYEVRKSLMKKTF